jgi:hypothetical protein
VLSFELKSSLVCVGVLRFVSCVCCSSQPYFVLSLRFVSSLVCVGVLRFRARDSNLVEIPRKRE